MKINFAETRKRMKFLKLIPWANSVGVSSTTVRRIVNEDYPTLESPQAKKVLDKLREAGFLVEVSDTDSSVRAA